jgi:hypothetical protein
VFDKLNLLLRTLLIGALVLLFGWWTLFLRGKLGENEEALAERDDRIESLADEVQAKQQRIDTLDQDVAARDTKIRQLGEEIDLRDRRITELDDEVARLGDQVRQLGASLRLLKVDHRLARVDVLEQTAPSEEDGHVRTRIRFVELDEDGQVLGPAQEATIEGRVLYIETLVIKFGDQFVEGGDALRGTSVCLFRRLFGEDQAPSGGTPIDIEGTRPPVYGGDNPPDPFYQELWDRFWDYANDPDLANEKGVRAIHGEAPFIELREGRSYRVELRASGGLTIRAED